MTEATEQKSIESSEFTDILRALIGQVVTMVNPESYEDAPMGSRITTGFYRAKVIAVGSDYLTVATEFVHKKGEVAKEPVKQFIPLGQVKRISLMKSDKLVHI